MVDAPDIARVVESLSEAQRRAIVRGKTPHRAVIEWLGDAALIDEWTWITGREFEIDNFTPLGLRVRAYLETQDAQG